MDEQVLQQQKEKKLEVDLTINQQSVRFEHQLLDPQNIQEQVETSRQELKSISLMRSQILKENAPAVAAPVEAQPQPVAQLVQAEPQQTWKQRREQEKQRKTEISEGQTITRNADTETIKIVRKMNEQAPNSDGPQGFKEDYSEQEMEKTVQNLIDIRITPDMFTPEKFADNSAILRETMYKYKHLDRLMGENPEFFEQLKQKDLFKFRALERCISMAEPLERMFLVASGASGLTVDGQGIQEKNIVNHARNIRAEQLESFRNSLVENDKKRDADLKEALDGKFAEETKKYQTTTKPEFQQLYHEDNPKVDWIQIPSFNYTTYFEETQAMRELIESKGEEYLDNKEVLDKMFSAMINTLEVYGELKAKSSAMSEVQEQYNQYFNHPRGGDGDLLFRKASAHMSKFASEGNDVIERFEVVKSAMKVLLKGNRLTPTDAATLVSFGYEGAEAYAEQAKGDAMHLAKRVNGQNETLERLLQNPRVHIVSRESPFVARAASMFKENNDEYNIGLLNFLQTYEQNHTKHPPTNDEGPEALAQYKEEQQALYNETKQKVMPSIEKILNWDEEEFLRLDDLRLADKQAELDNLFGDNMFISDLMKLKNVNQPHLELKDDILGDKMDEFSYKISILRGLAEKSRAIALKNVSKYGLLTDECFTAWELTNKVKSKDEILPYVESRLELGNRIINSNVRHYQDEHDPNSEAFKKKCQTLIGKKPTLSMLPHKESPFDDVAEHYNNLYSMKPEELSPEELKIVHRIHNDQFRLAGWNKQEAEGSGYPEKMGEAIFRGFLTHNAYDATKTMTKEEYKQMILDLGAGDGMEFGVTPQEELTEARKINMRGARQFKETIRLQYDMLSRKYGTAVENMTVSDIYDHYEEILRDFANVQVDLNFITKVPGIIDSEKSEDNILSAQVQYFSLMGFNIQNHLSLYASLGIPQEEITNQIKSVSETQCAEHKQMLLENQEQSHISNRIDWSQKVGQRRRPIE